MEAYTNMRIKMENRETAIIAVEKAKAAIMADDDYKSDDRSFSRFINDIRVNENEIIVEDSCTLGSWEHEALIPSIMKEIASINEVNSFKAETYYESYNCGYEAYYNADYRDGKLTIEFCGADSFYGSCSECGDYEIYFADYDPKKTYICEECGKELTEEELFPYGLPEVKTTSYDI